MATSATPSAPRLTPAASRRRRPLPIFTWAFVSLALLLVYNLLFARSFFLVHMENGRLVGNIINVLHYGSFVMLLSLGMTLVIATGGIDLSVGAIMAIAGGVSAILVTNKDVLTGQAIAGHSAALALAAGLAAGIIAGLWNGVLIGLVDIPPIIATLILMISGRGVAIWITRGQVPTIASASFLSLAQGVVWGIPNTILITLAVAALAIVLVRASALGLFIESIGNNASASTIAGINTRLVKIMAYGFTGFCAGLAGMMDAALNKAGDTSQSGMDIELDAIVAVAIGGTSLVGGRFSLIGSLVGALTMQTLKVTIQSSNIKPEFNFIVEAAVVVIICLLQSPRTRVLIQRFFRHTAKERP